MIDNVKDIRLGGGSVKSVYLNNNKIWPEEISITKTVIDVYINADFPVNMRFSIALVDVKTGQLMTSFGGTADELQNTTHTIDGDAKVSTVIGVNTTTPGIYHPSYHTQGVVGAYPKNVRHYELYIY